MTSDRFRFTMRTKLLTSTATAPRYIALRSNYSDRRITEHTAMVADGFPRSANSYIRWAIEHCQTRPGLLAGHTHSAGFVSRATSLGIPTMIVLREPRAACASLVQMGLGATPTSALRWYAKFHERILNVRQQVMIYQFEEVITDFSAVLDDFVKETNALVATYVPTSDSESRIRELVETANASQHHGLVSEDTVARPSARRSKPADVINLSTTDSRSLQDADNAYLKLLASTRQLRP